jgi:hypothetical protein
MLSESVATVVIYAFVFTAGMLFVQWWIILIQDIARTIGETWIMCDYYGKIGKCPVCKSHLIFAKAGENIPKGAPVIMRGDK